MLVTNRDVYIADFSIRSYCTLQSKGLSFKLLVYANCLRDDIKAKYFKRWKEFFFVEIFDNYLVVKDLALKAGDTIISPEGIKRVRDGACENYDELWTRELPKINTPYYATVDADFEILKPDFVFEMLRELEANDNLVAMSSDFTPARTGHFDSYSNEVINLNRRWDTWFCIYKKKSQVNNVSHFYFEELDPSGAKSVYDSGGYFQKSLIDENKFEIKAIDKEYQNQFIHYGAFSKNRTLNEKSIALYRKLSILKKVGLFNSNSWLVRNTIDAVLKKASFKFFKSYYQKTEKERRTYNFNE